MPISHSPTLPLLSTLIATIFISFGLNALIRPLHALSFFELYPSSTTPTTHDAKLLTALLAIYGIRNIFMGVAISIAAYYSKASTGANGYGRRVLGMLVSAAGVVAFADGVVCKAVVGEAEWGHWGYAPLLGVVGGLLCGVLD